MLQDELHPKFAEEKSMGNMRTLAFQVPEELFRKIKDYLQRNNLTQKEFVIGLIENEIERDLAQRQAKIEATDNSEIVIEDSKYLNDDELEQSECEDEGMGMTMGM